MERLLFECVIIFDGYFSIIELPLKCVSVGGRSKEMVGGRGSLREVRISINVDAVDILVRVVPAVHGISKTEL